MSNSAHFKVNPKLAELLGETYRSIEYAVKELVDNSYDADAENVSIIFPDDLQEDPSIVIEDDGSGMKENEIRLEYLDIANSRISRKGNFSINKNRKVKGRKGIGKFAGLMVANVMKVRTKTNGVETNLVINKIDLAKADYDIEKVPLPILTNTCDEKMHGTTIVLSGLNQNLNYPNPVRLKEILVREYGRENDFSIVINNENIGVLDLLGKDYTSEINLEDGKKAILSYTITDKPIRNSGISIRVNNKLIGKPYNFLENDDIIPKKLQTRIFGELFCDDLEEDITADYGAIIENSKVFNHLEKESTKLLKSSVDEVFKTDMKMSKARYQLKINRELEKLPEYKQPFARKAIYRILEKFYGEKEERINTIISVMVSALEKDYYWEIIKDIESNRDSDVEKIADALNYFGILEISIISNQAINRLRFLDELDILISNSKTLEKTMHKALEHNTWIFGDDYSLLTSEKTLKNVIDDILNKKYKGNNNLNRPDLLVGRKRNQELLLIELKRPSFILTRNTEMQALEYYDELSEYFRNERIEIMLIGKKTRDNIKTKPEFK